MEEIDSDLRRKAKAINFGIIYGISSFGLAKQLKIPKEDAKKYMDQYFTTYPEIKVFMEKTKEIARKQGFVETIIGRKCFLPEINSKNHIRRSLEERLAINAPIQGSAADMTKKAMVDLYKEGLIGHIQIHDELDFSIESEEQAKKIKDIMENAVDLEVPNKVDYESGPNWGEIK